jgi:hypothetical protein
MTNLAKVVLLRTASQWALNAACNIWASAMGCKPAARLVVKELASFFTGNP